METTRVIPRFQKDSPYPKHLESYKFNLQQEEYVILPKKDFERILGAINFPFGFGVITNKWLLQAVKGNSETGIDCYVNGNP